MAPSLEITLQGIGETLYPAERAILNVQAESRDADTAAEASAQVTLTANAIRDLLLPHCPPANAPGAETPITHYSMSSMDTNRSERRERLPDGSRTDPVVYYTAKAAFHVKFADFALLNTLATTLSSMEHVSIRSIDWKLTDATFDELKSGTRKKAAMDAIVRARDYAEVFCSLSREQAVSNVRPVQVKENGYYQMGTKPQLHYGKRQRLEQRETESLELHFEPEDVRIQVTVDVAFEVTGASA